MSKTHHRVLDSPALPEWAEAALNGSGHHATMPWLYQPDDWIAGEVVNIGEVVGKFGPSPFLDVKVEGGTTDGKPLETEFWRRIFCGAEQLRQWLERDDPKIGDQVAVRFVAKHKLTDSKSILQFDCGCVSADDENW